MDSTGKLYGVTLSGSTTTGLGGTVFQITPAGNMTLLYSFNGPGGNNPRGPLVRDAAGNLYGTTQQGGRDFGTAYKADSAGNYTIIHNFSGGPRPSIPSCQFGAGRTGQPLRYGWQWSRRRRHFKIARANDGAAMREDAGTMPSESV